MRGREEQAAAPAHTDNYCSTMSKMKKMFKLGSKKHADVSSSSPVLDRRMHLIHVLTNMNSTTASVDLVIVHFSRIG